jgi:hypothetical protein
MMEFELATPISPPATQAQMEDVRDALAATITTANSIGLASMTPRNSLASTTFCLANAGNEYLVYAPSAGSFTVNLSAGSGKTFRTRWINPRTGAITTAANVAGGSSSQSFTAPFNDYGAVLHLTLGTSYYVDSIATGTPRGTRGYCLHLRGNHIEDV